ncbi:MAG: ABC transporter ATP-binding protein [Gemmataceae bacterium]|nr:ABC transporter ATP-binding protein [Gemmataceae bacterium]
MIGVGEIQYFLMGAPLLEVQDVRKSFGPTVALVGVSFHVEAGEIFGLLGPNGAGKTTLLSIIAGLLAADSGRIFVAGRPFEAGDRAARRLIGIVPQELALYGELTAAENLRFFGELYGVRGAEAQRRCSQILEALGLEDRAAQRVNTFSGGMVRRLNLGAALMHQPRLLLLDEPTTGVDPQSRHRLFEQIRRLNAAGTTIVYTSHYMEEVQALCRRIGIIDHGRLAACDTVPNLLRILPARLRFRATPPLDHVADEFIRSGLSIQPTAAGGWELECADLPEALARVVGILQRRGLDLSYLETEEANLERVFLHLTGHQLRD